MKIILFMMIFLFKKGIDFIAIDTIKEDNILSSIELDIVLIVIDIKRLFPLLFST